MLTGTDAITAVLISDFKNARLFIIRSMKKKREGYRQD